MKVINAQTMRLLDQRTIEEEGVSGEVLMERAGRGAAEYVCDFLSRLEPKPLRRLVFLAGKGNNGGDAYVAARILSLADFDCVLYSVCEKSELGGDAAANAARLPQDVSFAVKKKLVRDDFFCDDVVVDGLLGTGFSGELREPYRQWIDFVNSANLPVIALDVPSGNCLKTNMTIAMGLPKEIIFSDDIECGMLRCVDIGIPLQYIEECENAFDSFFAADALSLLPNIDANAHKNSRGRCAVAAGSLEYAGAALLCAQSALRGGCGIVRLYLPRSVPFTASPDNSLIINYLPDNDNGAFSRKSLSGLEAGLEKSDCLVLGPGLSSDRSLILFLEELLKTELPMVIDADALNIIAGHPEIYRGNPRHVLTPHPGEMRRLMKAFDLETHLDSSRSEQALLLAERLNVHVVLKGRFSIVASPDGVYCVNSSGSPVLAKAGSGDCLAGLIGAFIAQKLAVFEAAKLAVFIHGLAGELNCNGALGASSADLIKLIPRAIRNISNAS